MKTNKEYQQSFRNRMAASGFIRKEYWIKPEWEKILNWIINKLESRKDKQL